MNLVTKSAIDFTAPAVMANGEMTDSFCFSDHVKGKYAILFFYPLDFTFVCPTELIALNNKVSEFIHRGVEVMGISVDSKFSHSRWRNTPTTEGGIGKVNYPLISDITKSISRDYGVLHNDSIALRATFIIDDKFRVRHLSIYDLSLGRDIDELIRIVDAIKHCEKHGEVCPAGWREGKASMQASSEGVADFLTSHINEL